MLLQTPAYISVVFDKIGSRKYLATADSDPKDVADVYMSREQKDGGVQTKLNFLYPLLIPKIPLPKPIRISKMPAANGTSNGNGEVQKFAVPKEMKAIRYNKIKDFSLVAMPVPEPKGHEVLIKGSRYMSRIDCGMLNSAQSSHAVSVVPIFTSTTATSTQQCPSQRATRQAGSLSRLEKT